MTTATTSPRRPPPQRSQASAAPAPTSGSFAVAGGTTRKARRVVLYGTGGIGKSTLAAQIRDVEIEPLFLDLEGGTQDMDVQRVAPPGGQWTFPLVRSALQSTELWTPKRAAVIDSGTKAQELAVAHLLATVKTQSNNAAHSIEDYGYGKGYQHLFEQMCLLLADMDRLAERGVNVVLICHDSRANVPNPMGPDYLRYEPNLYHSTTGKSSVRERVKEWCDDLLFIAYDLNVKDGKASGSGTRAIYTQETPMFLAKCRALAGDYVFAPGDSQIWKDLFGKDSK